MTVVSTSVIEDRAHSGELAHVKAHRLAAAIEEAAQRNPAEASADPTTGQRILHPLD